MNDLVDAPLISKELYEKISRKIFSYSLCMDYQQLMHNMIKNEPSIRNEATHFSMVGIILGNLLTKGPLPYITEHNFMNTLHVGVLKYLCKYSIPRERLGPDSILKMEACLRFLLVRSLLYSKGKFRAHDVEAAVSIYFEDDLDKMKNIVNDQSYTDHVNEYKNSNRRARSYFKTRLTEPAPEMEEDPESGALNLYEHVAPNGSTCSVKESLHILYECIQERATLLLNSLNPNIPGIADKQAIEGPSTGQLCLTSNTERQDSPEDENENTVDVLKATSNETEYSSGEIKVLEYVTQRLGGRTQDELISLATSLYRIMKFSQPFLNMHNY